MRRVILNFHGIGTPGRELEPGEAPYWITEAFCADILALANDLKPRVETSFTFDDGNLSDLAHGARLLEPYGKKADIFVLSSRIGTPGSLGPEDIAELVRNGHRIGLHGADHVDWRLLDAAGKTREFDTARAEIETVSGTRVTAAAIPFGSYNRKVLGALRRRGIDTIYSSDGGAWAPGDVPIPRTSPQGRMDLKAIEDVLLGRESPRRRLRRHLARLRKRWG